MTEKYGVRRVPKMYAKINELRKLIRSERSQRIQEKWDEVEEFIDFAFGKGKEEK